VHESDHHDRCVEEHIVPFPSAPIYGINRRRDYGYTLRERPNLHTLRVLRRPGDERIAHLFFLHNGLNEAENLLLYYRLADWIFSEYAENDLPGAAACVVAPFAGHLMHAPFHGPFSQTPLSRYLGDSGELFRQFLRYMVEMRWMLSAVAKDDDPWRVGWTVIEDQRLNAIVRDLGREWRQLSTASLKLLRFLDKAEVELKVRDGLLTTEQAQARREPSPTELIGTALTAGDIRDAVKVLRAVLYRGKRPAARSLKTHVVGYSLGGFLAQSVFFAWPQHISSCTTICSGGAISAISPTAFAHSEEWQAVLHSLRAELEDAMLHRRLVRDDAQKTVAGMPTSQFGYFKRVFDQVFLQEDQGSYRQRLSEYSARMLFVSGGEDPIVKPQNVLDASPREGINMLSIANLTHFLGVAPRGDRPQEVAQREFWLPEVGRLTARAAMRADELVDEELAAARADRDARERTSRTAADGADADPPRSPPRGPALTSSEFDEALDWVLDAFTEDSGWLIVSRNTLPAALLSPRHFEVWGAALHHHDARIQHYATALHGRATALDARSDRVMLLLPDKLEQWFVYASALFDPQSDTPRGRIMRHEDRLALWRDFDTHWSKCIRAFDPGELDEPIDERLAREELIPALTAWQGVETSDLTVTHLPDVWIALSGGDNAAPPGNARRRERFERDFVAWAADVVSELEARRPKVRKDAPRAGWGAKLRAGLEGGTVRIVQVSDAELNPRYRGRLERSAGPAARLLAQCAASMLRSAPRPVSPAPRSTTA
jgi:hypothetical protein